MADETPPLTSAQALMADYEWHGAVKMQTWAVEVEISCGKL